MEKGCAGLAIGETYMGMAVGEDAISIANPMDGSCEVFVRQRTCVPVGKRGSWRTRNGVCSECGHAFYSRGQGYCDRCGAKVVWRRNSPCPK